MLLFCIIASYCAINQWYVISPCCVIYNSWIYRNVFICYFLHYYIILCNISMIYDCTILCNMQFPNLQEYWYILTTATTTNAKWLFKLLIAWLHHMLQWIDDAMIFHHVLQYVIMNLQDYSYNLHFT